MSICCPHCGEELWNIIVEQEQDYHASYGWAEGDIYDIKCGSCHESIHNIITELLGEAEMWRDFYPVMDEKEE